jgi:hypothetical protein
MTTKNQTVPEEVLRNSSLFSRFAWAVSSAVVTFVAMLLIDWVFARFGLRREETLVDNFLLSALVFGLVLTQQWQHEKELERSRRVLRVVAEMNHHTRNALQVIVSRSTLSIADSNAISEIREAVKRIEWSLREVLPSVSDSAPRVAEDNGDERRRDNVI